MAIPFSTHFWFSLHKTWRVSVGEKKKSEVVFTLGKARGLGLGEIP
jgi:hypothetical protein